MSIVSQAYLELVRSRKQLEKAHATQDWQGLKDIDDKLGLALNKAFDDDQRNPVELIHEMENILNIYATIVASLPKDMPEALGSFPQLQS